MTPSFRESSLWKHSPREYSPKQGPAHVVSHARRVLNLVIIWILGYFWDAHMQLGSIPTSCHPKPQLSTMFGLCSDKKKLDFNNDGFARKESIKPASVTDMWFTTLKIQKGYCHKTGHEPFLHCYTCLYLPFPRIRTHTQLQECLLFP